MERIVVRLHVSTFNGSGHLLTIPGSPCQQYSVWAQQGYTTKRCKKSLSSSDLEHVAQCLKHHVVAGRSPGAGWGRWDPCPAGPQPASRTWPSFYQEPLWSWHQSPRGRSAPTAPHRWECLTCRLWPDPASVLSSLGRVESCPHSPSIERLLLFVNIFEFTICPTISLNLVFPESMLRPFVKVPIEKPLGATASPTKGNVKRNFGKTKERRPYFIHKNNWCASGEFWLAWTWCQIHKIIWQSIWSKLASWTYSGITLDIKVFSLWRTS